MFESSSVSVSSSLGRFLDTRPRRPADLRGDARVGHLGRASAGASAREDQELLPHKQRQPLPLRPALPQGAQGPRERVQGTLIYIYIYM